jgi:hypothetical protein
MVERAVYDGRENLRAVLGRDIARVLDGIGIRLREGEKRGGRHARLAVVEADIALEWVRRHQALLKSIEKREG